MNVQFALLMAFSLISLNAFSADMTVSCAVNYKDAAGGKIIDTPTLLVPEESLSGYSESFGYGSLTLDVSTDIFEAGGKNRTAVHMFVWSSEQMEPIATGSSGRKGVPARVSAKSLTGEALTATCVVR